MSNMNYDSHGENNGEDIKEATPAGLPKTKNICFSLYGKHVPPREREDSESDGEYNGIDSSSSDLLSLAMQRDGKLTFPSSMSEHERQLQSLLAPLQAAMPRDQPNTYFQPSRSFTKEGVQPQEPPTAEKTELEGIHESIPPSVVANVMQSVAHFLRTLENKVDLLQVENTQLKKRLYTSGKPQMRNTETQTITSKTSSAKTAVRKQVKKSKDKKGSEDMNEPVAYQSPPSPNPPPFHRATPTGTPGMMDPIMYHHQQQGMAPPSPAQQMVGQRPMGNEGYRSPNSQGYYYEYPTSSSNLSVNSPYTISPTPQVHSDYPPMPPPPPPMPHFQDYGAPPQGFMPMAGPPPMDNKPKKPNGDGFQDDKKQAKAAKSTFNTQHGIEGGVLFEVYDEERMTVVNIPSETVLYTQGAEMYLNALKQNKSLGREICKQYRKSKVCKWNDKCKFIHLRDGDGGEYALYYTNPTHGKKKVQPTGIPTPFPQQTQQPQQPRNVMDYYQPQNQMPFGFQQKPPQAMFA